MFELEGKVALITGGASGIGLATVKELLANGLKGITIVDFNDTAGEKVVQEVNEEFGANKAIFVKADVGDVTEFRGAFDATIEKFNNLDIVINNAGIMNEVEWEKMIKTNINGTVHGNILASEYLQKYKSATEGVVVNVASIVALAIPGCYPVYTATKNAIVGLSRSLGLDLYYNKYKIKTIIVCPGGTDTTIVLENVENRLNKEQLKMHLELYRLSTLQLPSQVAKELILTIKNGLSGSVWIIENNEPAYEIQIPHYSQMRIQ